MTLKRVNGLDTRPFYNLYPKKRQDGLPHATACPDWENAVYCLVSPVHTPKQSVLPGLYAIAIGPSRLRRRIVLYPLLCHISPSQLQQHFGPSRLRRRIVLHPLLCHIGPSRLLWRINLSETPTPIKAPAIHNNTPPKKTPHTSVCALYPVQTQN